MWLFDIFNPLKNNELLNDFDRQLLSSNLLGAKNLEELFRFERAITHYRQAKLFIEPIKRKFDYDHLKSIHEYLFKDIYVWAGMDRPEMGMHFEPFIKGKTQFTLGCDVKNYADTIFTELKEKKLLKNCKNIDEFAKEMTDFYVKLNALHPFREGNGRTTRIFLNQLADNAGHKMDLNLIDKNKLLKATITASIELNSKPLELLIKANLLNLKLENIKSNEIEQAEMEAIKKEMNIVGQKVFNLKENSKTKLLDKGLS